MLGRKLRPAGAFCRARSREVQNNDARQSLCFFKAEMAFHRHRGILLRSRREAAGVCVTAAANARIRGPCWAGATPARHPGLRTVLRCNAALGQLCSHCQHGELTSPARPGDPGYLAGHFYFSLGSYEGKAMLFFSLRWNGQIFGLKPSPLTSEIPSFMSMRIAGPCLWSLHATSFRATQPPSWTLQWCWSHPRQPAPTSPLFLRRVFS